MQSNNALNLLDTLKAGWESSRAAELSHTSDMSIFAMAALKQLGLNMDDFTKNFITACLGDDNVIGVSYAESEEPIMAAMLLDHQASVFIDAKLWPTKKTALTGADRIYIWNIGYEPEREKKSLFFYIKEKVEQGSTVRILGTHAGLSRFGLYDVDTPEAVLFDSMLENFTSVLEVKT